jgi:hypothetical protein
LVQNVKRDPFEQAVGVDQKTVMDIGGALAAPSTAFLYDWNLLPIGQQLWLRELGVLPEVPAAAGSGELQPQSGHGGGQEKQRQHSGLVTRRRCRAPVPAPARWRIQGWPALRLGADPTPANQRSSTIWLQRISA